MCLAKAKTQSSYCYNISNNDTKNMCILMFLKNHTVIILETEMKKIQSAYQTF